MYKHLKKILMERWDVFVYLFFGVLTTIVNYIIYLPLLNIAGLSAAISNVLAWIAAVTFAYLTNKPFVFKSYDWSVQTVLPELARFVSCRLMSGIMETLIILVAVDILGWNGNLWKLLTSVLVVILNYIFSKFFVFKTK